MLNMLGTKFHKIKDSPTINGVKKETFVQYSITSNRIYIHNNIRNNRLYGALIKKFTQSNFIWNKDECVFTIDFSEYAMRIIIEYTMKYSDTFYGCENVTHIYQQLNKFGKYYFSPTLVNVNGNYLIMSTNEYIDKAVKHIDLNDSIASLVQLARYGVSIDPNITQHNELLTFASKFDIEADITFPELLLNNILGIGSTLVVSMPLYKNEQCNFLFNELEKRDIVVVRTNGLNKIDLPTICKNPVLLCRASAITSKINEGFVKRIFVKNSLPIIVT